MLSSTIKPGIGSIKNLNGWNKAASITRYDFSTLYTNIPHGKLTRILTYLINFYFESGDGELIVVDRYGAQWKK